MNRAVHFQRIRALGMRAVSRDRVGGTVVESVDVLGHQRRIRMREREERQ